MERLRTTRAWARRAAPALLAALLHVVAAFLVPALPARHPVVSAHAPPVDEKTIDITLGDLDAPPTAPEPSANARPSDASEAEDSAHAAPALARASSPDRTAASPGAGRATEPSSAVEAAANASESGDRAVALVAPQPTDIGIGGRSPFLPRSEAAVEKAEAKRAVDQALREARTREKSRSSIPSRGSRSTTSSSGQA